MMTLLKNKILTWPEYLHLRENAAAKAKSCDMYYVMLLQQSSKDAMPDAKQELSEATGAYYWYLQLSWILSAVRYYDCDDEPKRMVNKYIYAGIDADIDNINFDEMNNAEEDKD